VQFSFFPWFVAVVAAVGSVGLVWYFAVQRIGSVA
jgi:hypothetical protein